MSTLETNLIRLNGKKKINQWKPFGNLRLAIRRLKNVVIADDTTNAKDAYKLICEGTGFLYKGDFQNAKQMLQAITRKIDS